MDNLWVWSPPRMGSTSVAKALEILGYDVVHHCPLTHQSTLYSAQCGLHDKTVVSTGLWLGNQILELIDKGKLPVQVIILEREWNSWRDSLDNFPISDATIQAHTDLFIRLYYKNSPQISSMDVLDGWQRLCTIVGKEIPNVEFPRLNESPQNWSI